MIHSFGVVSGVGYWGMGLGYWGMGRGYWGRGWHRVADSFYATVAMRRSYVLLCLRIDVKRSPCSDRKWVTGEWDCSFVVVSGLP